MTAPRARMFGLLCDPDGVVLDILFDRTALHGRLLPGQLFGSILAEGSVGKGIEFLRAVRSQDSSGGWSLDLRGDAGPVSFSFSGTLLQQNLLLIGLPADHAISESQQELVNEFARLNNEISNAHRELAKKNVELERLNEEKIQLLGMAAHDLRSPIAVIRSYSEFLEQDFATALSGEHRKVLSVIRRSSDFMLRLIGDVLSWSAIQTGKLHLDLRPIEIVRLVEGNLELNRVLADKKNVSIVLEADPEAGSVTVDRMKITQVMDNLVGNALKFSPEGGRILVRLSRDGQGVVLSVSDEGPGIHPDRASKLFRPFEAGSSDGTGLGLAIAKRMIEGHQGRIWVESEPPRGATFFVFLPARQPACHAAQASD